MSTARPLTPGTHFSGRTWLSVRVPSQPPASAEWLGRLRALTSSGLQGRECEERGGGRKHSHSTSAPRPTYTSSARPDRSAPNGQLSWLTKLLGLVCSNEEDYAGDDYGITVKFTFKCFQFLPHSGATRHALESGASPHVLRLQEQSAASPGRQGRLARSFPHDIL